MTKDFEGKSSPTGKPGGVRESANAMEPTESPKTTSEPRTIVISDDHFGFANMEAWLNIIRS